MSRRPLADRLLSPLALSNTALKWSVLIGGVGVLVFVPAQGAALHDWGRLVLVALVAEAAFAAVLMVLRMGGRSPGPARVALVLVAAGVARGVAIAVGMHVGDLSALAATDVLGRAGNSAVFCLLGGALIGATLAWRQDFHEQYRVLVDRALQIERAERDHAVDRDVLASWTSIKADLDTTLQRARTILAGNATTGALDEAATLLTSAIDVQLRPTSRAMWDGALPDRPPLSTRRLFVVALGSWQLPLRTILAFFGVLIGVGSIVRVGVAPGAWFTIVYLAVTAAVLGVSVIAARVWPQRTIAVAICTLVALPVLLFVGIALLADGHFGLPADRVSDVIIAIQAPVTTVLIAMAMEAVRERQRILDALQARIDADVIALLARAGHAHDDAQRLSVFMHHSVQSDLAASAMQLREAARTGEPATMRTVGATVLMRLSALQDIDAATPPWLGQPVGDERIDQVVSAWMGILDVTVSLPDARACSRDQWSVAAQVIEEGLANAARHGDASRVVIAGRMDDTHLTLSIEDDGSQQGHARVAGAAGMGTQWLDRIAPGDWHLRHSTTGSTLVVTIR